VKSDYLVGQIGSKTGWGHATVMELDADAPWNPGSPKPGAILTGVHGSPRGRGWGRKVLKRVLDDADAEGVVMFLSVDPDGTGLDHTQLLKWYCRNGFVPIDGSHVSLRREPRGEA
jgi:GNAT superfamily N-acetyltransferase